MWCRCACVQGHCVLGHGRLTCRFVSDGSSQSGHPELGSDQKVVVWEGIRCRQVPCRPAPEEAAHPTKLLVKVTPTENAMTLLTAPVVRMIRGVLSPSRVASADR